MADAAVSEVKHAYTEIERLVRQSENELAADEELIFGIASVPNVRVVAFGIRNNMLIFGGKDGGGRMVRVLQHYTQANVVLVTAPNPKDAPPAAKIGFIGEQ